MAYMHEDDDFDVEKDPRQFAPNLEPRLGYVVDDASVTSPVVAQDIFDLQQMGMQVEVFSIGKAPRGHALDLRILSGSFSGGREINSSTPIHGTAPALGMNPRETVRLHAQAAQLAAIGQLERFTHFHAADSTDTAIVCNLAARLTGIPFSFSTGLGRDSTSFGIHSGSQLIGESAFLISRSETDAYFLKQIAPESAGKIRRLYDAVDLEALKPGPDRWSRMPNFVAIGPLVEEHRFADLVEAIYLLKRMGVAANATVFGDGALKTRLKQQIAQRGIGDRVAVWQVGDTQYVREFVSQQATAVVMPGVSAVEPFPGVLLEAMAMGVPVLSSRSSVCHEFIEEGRSGFVLPPDDPVELATKCLMFAKNPNLSAQMGQEARRRAELLFDRRTRMAQLHQWFRDASDAYLEHQRHWMTF